jgi:hypothetical protein
MKCDRPRLDRGRLDFRLGRVVRAGQAARPNQ